MKNTVTCFIISNALFIMTGCMSSTSTESNTANSKISVPMVVPRELRGLHGYSRGEIFFSVKHTNDIILDSPFIGNGMYYYIQYPSVDKKRKPVKITGYHRHGSHGEKIDKFGVSWGFIKKIDAIKFEPFDFRTEIEYVNNEAKKNGKHLYGCCH